MNRNSDYIINFDLPRIFKKSVGKVTDTVTAIREEIATDIEAVRQRDPAARSDLEILLLYSGVHAILAYRVAHKLYLSKHYFAARAVSQWARHQTGIEIHPGATIGKGLFIDHGMGVVIGETTEIGDNCTLYQGVTLGAKSFPLDENGNPIKGIPRHPIIEDNVIIYSNSTVLGRITIGQGTVIGGNLWVTEGTRPGEKLMQKN